MEAGVPEDKLWKAEVAWYGLQKSPKWFQEFTEKVMEKLGMHQLLTESQMFTNKKENKELLAVYIHVDDPFFIGTKNIREFLEKLGAHVNLKDEIILDFENSIKHLSKNYAKTKKGFRISTYPSYVRDTQKLMGMENCRPVSTPGVVSKSMEEQLVD